MVSAELVASSAFCSHSGYCVARRLISLPKKTFFSQERVITIVPFFIRLFHIFTERCGSVFSPPRMRRKYCIKLEEERVLFFLKRRPKQKTSVFSCLRHLLTRCESLRLLKQFAFDSTPLLCYVPVEIGPTRHPRPNHML